MADRPQPQNTQQRGRGRGGSSPRGRGGPGPSSPRGRGSPRGGGGSPYSPSSPRGSSRGRDFSNPTQMGRGGRGAGPGPVRVTHGFAAESPAFVPYTGPSPVKRPTPVKPDKKFIDMVSIDDRGYLTVDGANCGLKDPALDRLLKWLDEYLKQQRYNPQFADAQATAPGHYALPKGVTRFQHFNLNGNLLADTGAILLANWLTKNESRINITNLRLFDNRIGDEGATALARYISKSSAMPLHELHLSHNRITTAGALEILQALAGSFKYPFPFNGRKVPLWLRMEHNFISTKQCLDLLNNEACMHCVVEGRDTGCTNRSCQKTNAKLHLAYFNFQYYHQVLDLAIKAPLAVIDPFVASPLVKPPVVNVLESVNQIGDAKGAALIMTTTGEEMAGPTIVVATPTVPENLDLTIKRMPGQSPLFLFLDTNAVVTMIKEPTSPLGFKTLADRRKAETFGAVPVATEIESIGNTCFFVITDTVLKELDGMSKRNFVKARVVEETLKAAEAAGFVIMPGVYKGENMAVLHGSTLSSDDKHIMDRTSVHDRKIIEVALAWNADIGYPMHGYICFVSNDSNARLVAHKEGLNSISLTKLNTSLKTAEYTERVWSGRLLRHLIQVISGAERSLDSTSDILSSFTQTKKITAGKSHLSVIKGAAKKISEAQELAKLLRVVPEDNERLEVLLSLLGQAMDAMSTFSIMPTHYPSASASTATVAAGEVAALAEEDGTDQHLASNGTSVAVTDEGDIKAEGFLREKEGVEEEADEEAEEAKGGPRSVQSDDESATAEEDLPDEPPEPQIESTPPVVATEVVVEQVPACAATKEAVL